MTQITTGAHEGRYGFKKSVSAIAEAVPITEVAARYTTLRPAGNSLRGRCPIHFGDNPQAFAVYPDQGSWHCFRCNTGGDVVALHFHAGNFGEMWEAMIDLASEYNVVLPERPKSWCDWQDEKDDRRAGLRRIRTRLYQRRMFKLFFADYIASIEDPSEREQEAQQIWDELGTACWMWSA
jgi:DNA primase